MNINYTNTPSSNDIFFITKQLNKETFKYGDSHPFAFFIRDDESNITAGANGFVIYGAIYTDQLWVSKNHRGQGIGRKIMGKVHELGKLQGCKIATVQTMSFHGAIGFYQKLGYTEDFKRDGYISGSSCFFLRKNL